MSVGVCHHTHTTSGYPRPGLAPAIPDDSAPSQPVSRHDIRSHSGSSQYGDLPKLSMVPDNRGSGRSQHGQMPLIRELHRSRLHFDRSFDHVEYCFFRHESRASLQAGPQLERHEAVLLLRS